jgi:apolipoprotein N-acyltransferase
MRLLFNKYFKTNTFILPITSGVLLIFTLPPFNISLLSWVSLVPMLFFVNDKKNNTKKLFQGGLIVGIIYFVKVVYPLMSLNAWWWLDVKGVVYENKALFLFWVLYFAVLCASLFFGLFAVLYRKLRKHNFLDVLIFPFIWVLFEFVRAKTLLGFTWGHLGYALHNNTNIMQIANIFSVYGLSFFIVAVNILIYIILRKKIDWTLGIHPFFLRKGNSFNLRLNVTSFRSSFWKNYLILVLIASFLIVNLYGYFSIKNAGDYKEGVDVAIIQPGLKTEEISFESFSLYIKMIREVLPKNPGIIILPENSFPFLIIDEKTNLPFGYDIPEFSIKEIFDQILNLSEDNPNTSFVVGFHTKNGKSAYNSLVVIEKGKITDIYHKRYLMPFSENSYSKILPTITGLNKGNIHQTIKIKGEDITALICSEIIFPKLSQNKNSKFIINIGNDGVFSSSTVAEQNNIIAKIRAVENRKFVLRAFKTGISSIIDPFGRVISQANLNKKQILFGRI